MKRAKNLPTHQSGLGPSIVIRDMRWRLRSVLNLAVLFWTNPSGFDHQIPVVFMILRTSRICQNDTHHTVGKQADTFLLCKSFIHHNNIVVNSNNKNNQTFCSNKAIISLKELYKVNKLRLRYELVWVLYDSTTLVEPHASLIIKIPNNVKSITDACR